ncbi:restriction endonuclease subunit S [Sulfitobacter sabulilitoris]|uniref:Restriction endonuclease subunit S n=1 Tax=Sulfitobacter sabulilitoris TaxID=2562655 RepID=A0A5S3PIC8_9RHOB|nr:restriction endonuclease subunit S [Sulfitobacter sabulilitoris]TMM54113.1 restriction endonuclease subunit S [Sulfitobacter sabulilitoris]
MLKAARKTIKEWQAEGVIRVEDGNHGENRPRKHEFSEEGMSFIRAADMRDGSVLFDSAAKIDHVAQSRVRKGIGQPQDILISHKGTVGRVARVGKDAPPFVCSPQTTFWRVLDENRVDRDYLFALMRSYQFQTEFAVRAGETDMAGYVSLTSQRDLELALPPINEQRAIGGMIGALDKKIGVNRWMSATLEEMARALYRSWFVDFDPVHARALGQPPAHLDEATAALFPDSFGPDGLPKGWKAGTLAEIASNVRQQVKPDDTKAETPYIGLEHMPRRSIALSDWGEAGQVGSAKSAMHRGQILFGKLRPYFHKVGIAPKDGICSTDILVIDAMSDRWRELVLTVVSSDTFVEHANASSSGTRMPRSNWKDMARYNIAIPPEPVVDAFSELVRPMTKKIVAGTHEAHTLAALRDTLLPRLMSGELRIREAEKQIEEVVE